VHAEGTSSGIRCGGRRYRKILRTFAVRCPAAGLAIPRRYETSSNVSRRRWSTRSLVRGCREFITTSVATLRGHEENRWVGRVVRTTLFQFQNNIGVNRGEASCFGKWLRISKRKFSFLVIEKGFISFAARESRGGGPCRTDDIAIAPPNRRRTPVLLPGSGLVHLDITVHFSPWSLLSARGWEYYRWLDSFLDRMEAEFSFDRFVEYIGRETALSTVIVRKHMDAASQTGSTETSGEEQLKPMAVHGEHGSGEPPTGLASQGTSGTDAPCG
jgi:hypothetical protein